MKSQPNGHKTPPASITRAALYRRTSTERQGERVSPEVQLSDCEAYAKAHGYTVTAVYTDTQKYRDSHNRPVEPSGERSDRPEFTRMLTDGRAGLFDVIIAWKEDRLYRGVKPAVLVGDLIEETGIRVELVKETFDQRMLYIKAAIGRLELQSIRERTEMGRHERVSRGLHHGGRVPRGYAPVTGPGGRTTGYTIVPEWRPFFDQLARLFLERRSYDDIAARLGTNPATGRRWLPGSIRHLAESAFYRGRVEYGRTVARETEVFDGVQPAMWDAATCAAIERELARRHALSHSAPRTRSALFSGLARCGICGAPMAANSAIHHLATGRRRYRSYGCWRSTYIRRGRRTGQEHAANFIAERKLLRLVKALLGALTVADVDTFMAGLTLSPDSTAGPDPLLLRADLAAAEAKLADLAVGLEGVRHASPAATDAILAELRRTGQHADHLRAEVRRAERIIAAGPDLAAVRAELMAYIDDPNRLDRLAPDDLRTSLQNLFPLGLFVAHGAIVPPVQPWK